MSDLKIGTKVIADEDVIVGSKQFVAARQNESGAVIEDAMSDQLTVVRWDRTKMVTTVAKNKVTVLEPKVPEAPNPKTATNHALLDSIIEFAADLRKLNEEDLEVVREEIQRADSLMDDAFDATQDWR